jgi:DnaJ-class molecular chaperone
MAVRLRRSGAAGTRVRQLSNECGGQGVLPNQRMKLSCRGGHVCRKNSVLSVAAPARSLCAIR